MMNKKGISSIVIILTIVGVLLAGGGIYWWQKDNINKMIFGETPKGCMQEAKICPDGSSVSRTGPNCEFASCPGKEKAPILEELNKLNIQVIGQPKQIEFQLPSALTGSNWGLKKTVCQEGGYDLSLYAGKLVLLTSHAINEKFKNEPLDVWIISSGDKIACVYKAVRDGSNLTPGVFPVEKKCASVGEEMSPKEYGQGDRCCVGLTQIETSRYFYPCDNPGKNVCDKNGCSIPPPTSDQSPWWQCAPCGNGICESVYGENKCNCPNDCK